jgi:hypothetical protein
MIPLGAALNSTSFSTGLCGAWSVAIASIVPVQEGVPHGLDVMLRPQGGAIFAFVS